MAKKPFVAEEQTPSQKGRDPDWVVLQRQQPQFNKDGELERSENMSVVGAGWETEKPDRDTGEMIGYIGIKCHLKIEVGPEGLLLRKWSERDKR